MKNLLTLLLVLVIVLPFSVYAQNSSVIYSGDSGNFIFNSLSSENPTDLFNSFKGVMPGDTVTQTITVKNKASNKVKVKIYIRSLGASEEDVDFLSQLHLKVKKGSSNDMAYMFDAAANETAGLESWVEIGTLYSGGEVNLDIILEVPTELGSEFSDKKGEIIWEFKVEEYAIEDTDPTPPPTGDKSTALIIGMSFAIVLIFILFFLFKRRKTAELKEKS